MDNDAQVSTVGVFSGNGSSFANRIALARQVEDDGSGSRAPGDNLQWEALTADLELWAERIETLALRLVKRSTGSAISSRLPAASNASPSFFSARG